MAQSSDPGPSIDRSHDQPGAFRRRLAAPVTTLRGVGIERADQLARLAIHTIGDLLLHVPRRYEDRRRFGPIRDLVLGEPASVCGKIVAAGTHRYRQGQKSVFEIVLDDGTSRLHCRWWNLPFMERMFNVGEDVMAYGKPVSLRPRTIDHPETEVRDSGDQTGIHLHRIVPIYPLTEGLPQRTLRTLIWKAMEQFGGDVFEPDPSLIETFARPLVPQPGSSGSPVPPSIRVANIAWPTRREALRMLHFPGELSETELGRRRLALDEFIELQMAIQQRRRNLETKAQPYPCAGDNRWVRPFLSQLGFSLTSAQTRVLREIRADLGGSHPMRRLLQGDVGSGKTVVAACAALMTLESGYAVALMVPTEILAEQHGQNFQRWFKPLGIPIELRTSSSLTSSPRSSSTGSPGLIIGTHALIEENSKIANLGLVIIDEQHKFGVAQREQLVRKGRYPHLLIMTATPIPRTLGLTLYADLDVSTLDQLPTGRPKIRTHIRAPAKLPQIWSFVKDQLNSGRQAYVVYPRVVESDRDEVKAVTREFGRVQAALAPHAVGLLHGQLPGIEKDRVMSAFRTGEAKVLLATSVIEVGVDVPNATVMVIENAEQFGLAQLHQLRGRIGRGIYSSHCILIAEAKTEAAQERLKIFASTTDGFAIAEADFRLRGPGELLGRTQAGLPRLRFGDLTGDRELLELARELVHRWLAAARPTAGK